MVSAAENSNKFQKTRFWKEKSVENVVTLDRRLAIQFKHCFISYLAVQKIHAYIAKQCSHVEFPSLFCNGFVHTWANGTGHIYIKTYAKANEELWKF